jgi:hypothetical protein
MKPRVSRRSTAAFAISGVPQRPKTAVFVMDMGPLFYCLEQRISYLHESLLRAHRKFIYDLLRSDNTCHVGDNLPFLLLRLDCAFENNLTRRGDYLHAVSIKRQALVGDNSFANLFACNVIRLIDSLRIKGTCISASVRSVISGGPGTSARRYGTATRMANR